MKTKDKTCKEVVFSYLKTLKNPIAGTRITQNVKLRKKWSAKTIHNVLGDLVNEGQVKSEKSAKVASQRFYSLV